MSNTVTGALPVEESAATTKVSSAIYIIASLFFVLGFITWTNSVLIPYLKIACQLNNFESYFVAFAVYIAYLVMAVPSAKLLQITGFKNGMSIALFIIAVGAAIFIPAAMTRLYPLFLTGLFIQGTGMAVLQTASNPYITILGPMESAAKRISIMGICNKAAGAIAPIILGAVTLKNADGLKARLAQLSDAGKVPLLNELAQRVIVPYIVIIVVLLILSVLIYFSSLPEVEAPKEEGVSANAKTSIFHFPHLLVGALALFVYVGVEVLAGDSIVNYGSIQGISLSASKFFTACTLSGMVAGYIIGIIYIPKYIQQETALKASALLGIIFSIMALVTHGLVSVLFIALLGLANSMMWPTLWPLCLKGLGSFTKTGSSLLIMGIAGGALIPLLYGRLSDLMNPQMAYVVLLPCYLIIGYFALWGHKLKIRY